MRKAISLVLVFSILLLSGTIFAKEKKGADLIIRKTDGQQVMGELIAIKQASLLLLERESGVDVTVDVGDVSVITIVKKGRKGFLIGSIPGAVLGGAAGIALTSDVGAIVITALVGGLATGLIGAIISGISSKDKKIQIEGKSDSEIQEIFEQLRMKARIKNAQ